MMVRVYVFQCCGERSPSITNDFNKGEMKSDDRDFQLGGEGEDLNEYRGAGDS